MVANAAMNRGRGLEGVNSYARELGIDLRAVLLERMERDGTVSWLDLCCGEGHALLSMAGELEERGLAERARLVGLDLLPPSNDVQLPSCLRYLAGSVRAFEAGTPFDVITCVHGLHYLGDKLGALTAIQSWLSADGGFFGNLDLADIRRDDDAELSGLLRDHIDRAGGRYDAAAKLVLLRGGSSLSFPLRYTGADDAAGPNYTHQPTVRSFYEPS